MTHPMRTFYVYHSDRYLGTIQAPTLELAQTAANKAFILPCKVRPTPPPPVDAWRVGSDGRLYRH
jgi:hypothetical protein